METKLKKRKLKKRKEKERKFTQTEVINIIKSRDLAKDNSENKDTELKKRIKEVKEFLNRKKSKEELYFFGSISDENYYGVGLNIKKSKVKTKRQYNFITTVALILFAENWNEPYMKKIKKNIKNLSNANSDEWFDKMMNKLKELLDYMIEEKYISEKNEELIDTVLSNLENLLISFTMIEVSQSRNCNIPEEITNMIEYIDAFSSKFQERILNGCVKVIYKELEKLDIGEKESYSRILKNDESVDEAIKFYKKRFKK